MRMQNNLKTVHSSQGLARNGRSRTASYRPSLCVFRVGVPHRLDVNRRIPISVMDTPAFRASPLSDGKRQRFNNMSAIAAKLTGRKPAVHLDQLFAIPFALIVKHPGNRPQGRIRQTAGQRMVTNHTANVKVLNANYVKSPDKIGCELVQIISACIYYLAMQAGNSQPLALSALTPWPLSRQRTLSLCQFTLRFHQPARVGNALSIRKSAQPIDTQVNANTLARFWQGFNAFVQNQCHKVPSIRRLGYRHGGWLAGESSGPANIQPPQLCHYQIAILGIPLERTLGVFSRLFTSLLLERGVARSLIKEIAIGYLKVSKGLLSRDAGNFIQPLVTGPPFQRSQGSRRRIVVNSIPVTISISTQPKRPIIDESARAKDPGKCLLLVRRRIKAELITKFHKIYYILVSAFGQGNSLVAFPLPAEAGSLQARTL